MDATLTDRTYRLAEVCYAIGVKPEAFKQLVKRGILAPGDKPALGAPRGYRLVEIWSAALILELAKFGLTQMEAARAVAGISAKNPLTNTWWIRDQSVPLMLVVRRWADGKITQGTKCIFGDQLVQVLKGLSPIMPKLSGVNVVNVTRVLAAVEDKLRKIIAEGEGSSDEDEQ